MSVARSAGFRRAVGTCVIGARSKRPSSNVRKNGNPATSYESRSSFSFFRSTDPRQQSPLPTRQPRVRQSNTPVILRAPSRATTPSSLAMRANPKYSSSITPIRRVSVPVRTRQKRRARPLPLLSVKLWGGSHLSRVLKLSTKSKYGFG
jgi:hypothetical protein